MTRSVRTAALAAVLVLVPACNGGLGGRFQGFYNPFPNTVTQGTLRGSQVVPAIGTGAAGTATVTVDGLRTFVDYTIDATGIASAVTAIEIRQGVPGTNGAVLFSIPVAAFPVSGRLTGANFNPMSGVGLSQAGDLIASGGAYLLISSANFPAGELRGHLGAAALASAALTGSQENPPLSSPGSGAAVVSLSDAQDQLTATVTVNGLTGITGAQIFDGKPGVNGSAALFSISSAAFATSATAVLTAGDFTPSATITTFVDAVNALLSGGLYVQVLTTAQPTGEIRGQIGPVQMNAVLSGADFVQPVTTTATGSATVTLDALQTQFLVLLTHTVASPTTVTMNAQLPGSNGPEIFDVGVIAGSPASPLAVTMTANRLVPAPSRGIDTFADFVNALLNGQTYIQVASTGFPSGEIRGQLLP